MAVYSVNRRRAILLLVLTSVLLLTVDLRGNAVVDVLRSGFSRVLSPFEKAADVVATPIRNLWHGATDYQELERKNQQLEDQLARQRGDQLSAAAVVLLNQQLMALARLETLAGYEKVTVRVVGDAPGNFNQLVEIDHGSDSGILVGMPVVNFAGLVGKVTKVYPDRSVVMLATDQEYAIPCKVSTAVAVTEAEVPTQSTTASGINVEDLSTTTTSTTTTTTTTIAGQTGGATTPTTVAFQLDDLSASTSVPGQTTTTDASPATTSTTLPPLEIERGVCKGRGRGRLPIVSFVTENPSFGKIGVGSIVSTAGGSTSLAPPDIGIGTITNVAPRAGSAGPILEIELVADLDQLTLLQVVRYRPPSEVTSGG